MFDVKTKTTDYMSIVLTHECTRACPFCIDKHRGNGRIISRKDFLKGLRFAKKQGIRDILLTGGEPTLHPDVLEYAKLVKDRGFRLIFTSNADNPEILYQLDKYVDCFNFSHYNQEMPDPSKFHHADLTISKLLFEGDIDNRNKLNAFVRKYSKDFFIKFSTMTPITKWAENHNTSFVDDLKGKNIVIFGEVPALIYRKCLIKRYDCTADAFTPVAQSWKCLANGKIHKEWEED